MTEASNRAAPALPRLARPPPDSGALRYERKFVAPDQQARCILAWLRGAGEGLRPAHPDRCVNNLYFDTHLLRAFGDNVGGLRSRTKLRYRWYGGSVVPDTGALEAKRRQGAVGWKERYPVAAPPFSPGDSWAAVVRRLATVVPAAGRLWLATFPLVVLVNRYQRAYFQTPDGQIRVTVDRDLRFWDQRFRTRLRPGGAPRRPSTAVVEFKFAEAAYARASSLMQGLPLRVSRYSKYAVGVGLLRHR